MADTQAGIPLNDLATHYENLADQAALRGESPSNGKQR
jgi:hypothetical protein